VTKIDVRATATPAGWTCRVRVDEGGSATEHTVTVSSADLARLAPGAGEPIDLVRRSFEFLLERESNESILRTFDLTVIGRYFPDYERTIKG
jgi:hypothetical protein